MTSPESIKASGLSYQRRMILDDAINSDFPENSQSLKGTPQNFFGYPLVSNGFSYIFQTCSLHLRLFWRHLIHLAPGGIGFAEAEKLFRFDVEVPKTEEDDATATFEWDLNDRIGS